MPVIKRLSVLSLVLLCQFSNPVVAAETGDAGELHLYNWADYVPDVLIDGFEQETGIRVVYNKYDNDYMLPAKLFAGYTGYDLVGMAEVDVQMFLSIDQFLPLDKDRLPNLANLDPHFMDFLATSDPDNRHSVPYFWGSAGIAYNVDMIRERMPDAPVDSWALLFEPELIQHFADCGVAFLDDANSTIRMVLLYLGYDIDERSEEAFAAVEKKLKKVRPYIRYFSSTRLAVDLPGREICLALNWNGDFGNALKTVEQENIDIRLAYEVPKEGSYMWVDTWSILADAPNPDNAYKFLDYLMRAEVMASVSNSERYPNANLASRQYLIPQIVENPELTHTPEMQKRLHARIKYDMKTQRRANRLWARFKGDF